MLFRDYGRITIPPPIKTKIFSVVIFSLLFLNLFLNAFLSKVSFTTKSSQKIATRHLPFVTLHFGQKRSFLRRGFLSSMQLSQIFSQERRMPKNMREEMKWMQKVWPSYNRSGTIDKRISQAFQFFLQWKESCFNIKGWGAGCGHINLSIYKGQDVATSIYQYKFNFWSLID